MEEDEFLVLACDGVWDVMTNEDICQFIAARMRITDDLELIANEVIDTCLHKVENKFDERVSSSTNKHRHCRGVVTT